MLWLAAALAGLYAAAVLALMVAGRRVHARALAGFIPDCVVLMRRLAAHPEVPRRRKLLAGFALGYLLVPIDLVPDFIPVAGQLDDAIVVALALRGLLRGAGDELVRELWPGPQASLRVIMLAASRGGSSPPSSGPGSPGRSGAGGPTASGSSGSPPSPPPRTSPR
jgi:uncharacterized membrane protein YkvA (DUF1232 family)